MKVKELSSMLFAEVDKLTCSLQKPLTGPNIQILLYCVLFAYHEDHRHLLAKWMREARDALMQDHTTNQGLGQE